MIVFQGIAIIYFLLIKKAHSEVCPIQLNNLITTMAREKKMIYNQGLGTLKAAHNIVHVLIKSYLYTQIMLNCPGIRVLFQELGETRVVYEHQTCTINLPAHVTCIQSTHGHHVGIPTRLQYKLGQHTLRQLTTRTSH